MPMFHGKDSKCLVCRCSLEGMPSSTIYCSRECRRAYHRSKRPGNPQTPPETLPLQPPATQEGKP